MLCRKCGEDNPENAVFCRNCGERLQEEVKKVEIIEEETRQKQATASPNKNNSDIMSCCICIIAVFIIFGILGAVFHI